jgi:hypothetical protein
MGFQTLPYFQPLVFKDFSNNLKQIVVKPWQGWSSLFRCVSLLL